MRGLVGYGSGFVVVASLIGATYGVCMFVFGRWLVKALAEVPVA